ncbi:alpha/beta fold hydrolase [Myxococcus sp. RHSTA-1-4]|uniref:alpha/beta fold hydrolase n=1 Tax=Myxococcus sp. RHSTA-1-4 TaxID=2874601 RepID=UPI001CBC41DD|nr:alpha/beta hydrolase [Myxococcus sp. RHSTA-1-4]MBZ4419864.1 alpha/beta hydrolase [Myxococcus sp. RHSTA-1-4]
MPYRRATRFVTAPDGTRVAWHTHFGNLREETADAEMAGRRTVLLTNGIGTSENFWRYIVASLEQDHRVVHWDYRGHGGSEDSRSGDYRVPVHVEDLERITEEVMARGDGSPPLHVAFSMGVRVLLELYRRRPDLVPAMTLVAGTPGAPGSGTGRLLPRAILFATRGVFRAATPALPLAAPMAHSVMASRFAYPLGRAVGALRPRAPRADIDEFMKALRRMSPEAYWYTLRGLAEGHAWDVVPGVRVPTLIIAARDDTLVPLREMERMRDAMPHAHWLRVDDAGHAGLLEAGTEIADAVRGFLMQHGMEPPGVGRASGPEPFSG